MFQQHFRKEEESEEHIPQSEYSYHEVPDEHVTNSASAVAATESRKDMHQLDEVLATIAQDLDVDTQSKDQESERQESAPKGTPKNTQSAPTESERERLMKFSLAQAQKHLKKLESLLGEDGSHQPEAMTREDHDELLPGVTVQRIQRPSEQGLPNQQDSLQMNQNETQEEDYIQGVFDGENMVGPEGKQYSVPANYASKSKLVEGDILKLKISDRGHFIYKQIGPIARKRIVGTLEQDPDTRNYVVTKDDHQWRVLTASVTYYKGMPGDEVVILAPRDYRGSWGAVENIIKRNR